MIKELLHVFLLVCGIGVVICQNVPMVCPDATGMVGICVEECSGPSNCPQGKLCCSNGCGHTCQTPVPGNMTMPCPMCSDPCEYGFIYGTDGCPDCKCAENPCLVATCPIGKTCQAVLPTGALYAHTECVEGPYPAPYGSGSRFAVNFILEVMCTFLVVITILA